MLMLAHGLRFIMNLFEDMPHLSAHCTF